MEFYNLLDGDYAHGDLGFSLKYSKSPRKRRQQHDLGTLRFQYIVRFHYASTMRPRNKKVLYLIRNSINDFVGSVK